jgi:ATP-dependent Clp protease adaptor protein ClpS
MGAVRRVRDKGADLGLALRPSASYLTLAPLHKSRSPSAASDEAGRDEAGRRRSVAEKNTLKTKICLVFGHAPMSGDSFAPGGASMSGGDDDGGRRDAGSQVITRQQTQTRKPALYRVLLLNDDYTPMEFVIEVLKRFFGKDEEEATHIMLHVHHNGVGLCGIYTYEIAETKVTQVMEFARKHQHPLQCIMEKQ